MKKPNHQNPAQDDMWMGKDPQAEEDELRRWRDKELELIIRVGQTLNSILDLDQVLTVFLSEVRNILNVAGTSIWVMIKSGLIARPTS